MPISAAQRAALLTAATVLLAAGCSDGGDDAADPGTPTGSAGLSALTSQKLSWAPCPAPSAAEGGSPPRRWCRG